MRLDRRQFHSLALAFLANGIVAHGARATALDPAADRAVIALNRLSFGASAAAIKAFNALGKQAWLDRQLSLRPEDDTALARRLAWATLRIEYEAGNDGKGRDWPARKADLPYRHLDATGPEILALINYDTPMDYEERIRPAREVQAASLIRAVHAEAQLREVMTQFWHNHFNVNALRDETTAANFPAYDRVMRDNALGNFRTLLGQMARSPSMLFYLNNEASRASPANENFARELLELHTLGAEYYFNGLYDDWKAVPGALDGVATGYIDQDVYEVARAFTGWSYGDGRWIADGDEAPRTGEFHYIDAWHDPYQKRILGHEFRPNGAPLSDGDRTLDLLARHPGTARFISRKLIRRLVLDTPDEAFVDATADIFLAHADADDQLAQVVRFIVMSDAFDTSRRKSSSGPSSSSPRSTGSPAPRSRTPRSISSGTSAGPAGRSTSTGRPTVPPTSPRSGPTPIPSRASSISPSTPSRIGSASPASTRSPPRRKPPRPGPMASPTGLACSAATRPRPASCLPRWAKTPKRPSRSTTPNGTAGCCARRSACRP